MKSVKVKIELEYFYDTNSNIEATELAENEELPSGYVEDSFEILDVRYIENTKQNKAMYLTGA